LAPSVCKHFAGLESTSFSNTSLSIYSSVENRKSNFGFYMVSTIIGDKQLSAINSRQDLIETALTT